MTVHESEISFDNALDVAPMAEITLFDPSMRVDQENQVRKLLQTINHVLSNFQKDDDEKHVREELSKLKERIFLMFIPIPTVHR